MPLKVIISGASSGLGRALTQHYTEAGATLGLIARRRDLLETLAAGSSRASIYEADVRDAGAIRAAGEDFMRRYGCPDVVIANAGISRGTLTAYAEDNEVFEDIVTTNVLGMVNLFQPFLAAMQAAGRGSLVGIASVAGYRGLPGGGAYSASKAAAISYLESLRVEMYGSGVSVITICPGYIVTPMTANNPYRMPFILTAEVAAEKIITIVENKVSFAVIPWQMAIVARILKLLPDFLYDRLFANAPRKPGDSKTNYREGGWFGVGRSTGDKPEQRE
ncbi:SDR family oxidoreductase [Nitrosospira sp. Is2]|uniref:SDR family oxidoreductase n=1 Tax=Nitrosospira sp. Is2 TaxID=3080532 RepID=UPI002953EDE3|nr:SDR family oxidoreductase [Nitrosospira sp. Is2]WON72745.1 SDR family oxidoreductase [Nitrosospira sp. Is2]